MKKKTNVILPCLVLAAVYILNIAIAFIVAIECGSRPVNKVSIILFVAVLAVGVYLVRGGIVRRIFGQILVTVSAAEIFSTLVYDPLCFRVNYFGRNMSETVATFAEGLLPIGAVLFVAAVLWVALIIAEKPDIDNKKIAKSWLPALFTMFVYRIARSDNSLSGYAFTLIMWAGILASFYLVAGMTRKNCTARRAMQYGYGLFIITSTICAIGILLRMI